MAAVDGVANDGSYNLNVDEWWVKSDDGQSVIRAYRGTPSKGSNQPTMSYSTGNPNDGDRLLMYGLSMDDYWRMDIATAGITAGSTLKIEGEMQSSAAGPRDFTFEYSTDNSQWTEFGTLTANSAAKTAIDKSFTPESDIPGGTLYIRMRITSNISTSGGAVNPGGGGTSRICRPQYTSDEDKKPIMKVTKL
jgi:hypothetical protein